jgi:hypothetical protein
MKKTLLAILLVISSTSMAQVTTPTLTCAGRGVPFTVKFDGMTTKVTFKGWTYTANYSRGFVGDSGERWSNYKNTEIEVSTTWPIDNYVAVYNQWHEVIGSAFCR